jgi:hypothetical protein
MHRSNRTIQFLSGKTSLEANQLAEMYLASEQTPLAKTALEVIEAAPLARETENEAIDLLRSIFDHL